MLLTEEQRNDMEYVVKEMVCSIVLAMNFCLDRETEMLGSIAKQNVK